MRALFPFAAALVASCTSPPPTSTVATELTAAGPTECGASFVVLDASHVRIDGVVHACSALALDPDALLITLPCAEALDLAGGDARACVVTAREASRVSVSMELPETAAAAAEPTCTIAIVISPTGTIMLDGEFVELATLGAEVRTHTRCDVRNARAIIEASRDVPYEHTIAVMEVLREQGFGKISFHAAR